MTSRCSGRPRARTISRSSKKLTQPTPRPSARAASQRFSTASAAEYGAICGWVSPAEGVAAAAGQVGGDDDVHRGVEDGLDLQFLELLRPALGQRLGVRLALALREFVHVPAGLGGTDDHEIPRLRVPDRRRGVRRLQHAEQHVVRDRVAAEAVADVPALAHHLQHGLALGVVVGGSGRSGGLSYVFHYGRALFFLIGGPGVQVVRVLYEFRSEVGVRLTGCGHGGERVLRADELLLRRERERVRRGRREVRGGGHRALHRHETPQRVVGVRRQPARRLGVRVHRLGLDEVHALGGDRLCLRLGREDQLRLRFHQLLRLGQRGRLCRRFRGGGFGYDGRCDRYGFGFYDRFRFGQFRRDRGGLGEGGGLGGEGGSTSAGAAWVGAASWKSAVPSAG